MVLQRAFDCEANEIEDMIKDLAKIGIKNVAQARTLHDRDLARVKWTCVLRRKFLQEVGVNWSSQVASDDDTKRWAGRPPQMSACEEKQVEQKQKELSALLRELDIILAVERKLKDKGIWNLDILKCFICEADLAEFGLPIHVWKSLLDGAWRNAASSGQHLSSVKSGEVEERIGNFMLEAAPSEVSSSSKRLKADASASSSSGKPEEFQERTGTTIAQAALLEVSSPSKFLKTDASDSEAYFEKQSKQLAQWYQEHPGQQPKKSSKDFLEKDLGMFMNNERTLLRKGTGNDLRSAALERIDGWKADGVRDASWTETLEALRAFLLRTESHAYPKKTATDAHEKKLARWVKQQRETLRGDIRTKDDKKGNVSQRRVELLEALPGWTWPIQKKQKER